VPLADWARLSRWPEWAESKLPFSGAAALLLASPSWPRLLAIMATISLWAAFGYGVNEVADRRSDRTGGKPNRAAGLPGASWMAFLVITAGGAFGLSLVWAADVGGPALVLIGLALALMYSVPPIRLKERGLYGLAGAAMAQWSLPVLAASGAEARGWAEPAAWSFALLGLALGMRWMATHQRRDMAADRRSAVSTYASVGGNLEGVILAAFASELVLLATTLALGWPRSIPAVAALTLWLSFELAFMRPRLGRVRARLHEFVGAPLAGYYFLVFPLALAVGEGSWPGYGVVVAVFLTLGSPYLYRMLRGWPERARSAPSGDAAPTT
jgi:4-hydroxybenzoate polyprenyltransferase